VDVYNPKVVRATMGSIFRVPIYHHERGEDIIRRLKEKGATVILFLTRQGVYPKC